MQCPYCQSSSSVTNSRSKAGSSRVWRRRQCKSCNAVWTTTETIELTSSHRIKHADGTFQAFERDVLFLSIIDALRHRKSAQRDATALTDTIIKLVLRQKDAVIEQQSLQSMVQTTLERFDPVAGTLYQALHKK